MALVVVLAVLWVRFRHVSPRPFFLGLIAYCVVAEAITGIFYIFVTAPFAVFPTFNRYSVGGIITNVILVGVLEETARFVCFKLLLRRYSDRDTAITYGIGHAGAEALMYEGFTFLVLGVASLAGLSGIVQNYSAI